MDDNTEELRKGTLLVPGEEYKDFVNFCKEHTVEPIPEAEFYKIAYFVAIRAVVLGLKEGIGAYSIGPMSLMLCPIKGTEETEDNLALALYITKELEKYEKEGQSQTIDPTAHFG